MNPHQHTTTIQTSPGQLWSLCSNPVLWSQWDPEVKEARLIGSMRIGATGHFITVRGKQHPFRVLVCDPSQSLLFSYPLSVGADVMFKIHWENLDTGLRLTGEVQLVGPLAALRDRLHRNQLVQHLENAIQGLKRALEGSF